MEFFRPKSTKIDEFYFWFSLLFLYFRILIVTLSAAKINDESKRPIDVLRAIPQDCYHREVILNSQ